MTKAIWAIPAIFAGIQFAAVAEVETVSAGTEITVRTNQGIDARNGNGRVYTGVVDRDVLDSQGRVAIPRGSDVELIARSRGDGELSLDLDSVTAFGHRYAVAASDAEFYGKRRDGVGENGRTAKYVGGGALLGTIIGAIAGGGKGAAIGAAAGAASGAGTQMATRGRRIHVPAESLLTFRLERSIHLGEADRGYTRDGHHYHN